MSEAKTYVFGNEGSGMLNMLTPLLSLRGLDPNMVFAMMNNKGGQGWENNGMWWIIILFFLLWGRNGWGNENNGNNGNCGYNGLANLINNDKSADMIMSAIQGNGTAISQLASTLNCDVNSIQSTLNSLGGQLCSVGNQVGLTGLQVINSIQQGNMSIVQQLCNCCCEVKQLVSSQGYKNLIATLNQTNQLTSAINNVATGQERGFSSVAYATLDLTCQIKNAISDGIGKVLAGQKEAELREITRDLAERDRKISEQAVVINNAQQSALFGQMIGQAVAPINASLAGLTKEVADIQCHLPETKTIPCPDRYIPLNMSANIPFSVGYGCGCGYGFGYNYPNGFSTAF